MIGRGGGEVVGTAACPFVSHPPPPAAGATAGSPLTDALARDGSTGGRPPTHSAGPADAPNASESRHRRGERGR